MLRHRAAVPPRRRCLSSCDPLASNPFLREVLARIKTSGGWSPIFERIAKGEALSKIVKDYDCSRHTLYKLLHKKDALWTLFQEARRESAMALAEEATEIGDGLANKVDLTREDVALGKIRIEQRRWLAQAYDRETFGIQQAAPQQQLSIGELYLSVLQAPPTPKQLPRAPITDAEIVTEPTT